MRRATFEAARPLNRCITCPLSDLRYTGPRCSNFLRIVVPSTREFPCLLQCPISLNAWSKAATPRPKSTESLTCSQKKNISTVFRQASKCGTTNTLATSLVGVFKLEEKRPRVAVPDCARFLYASSVDERVGQYDRVLPGHERPLLQTRPETPDFDCG